MKKIINIMLILAVLIFITLSIKEIKGTENEIKSLSPKGLSDPDEFLIGAYHIGCASQNRLQALGMNIWHEFIPERDNITISGYNQHIFPHGFTPHDSLFANITNYQSEVNTFYNNKSTLNNNYLYFCRPKLEMLTFAQRSDYHPFAIANHQLSDKGQWWYGYDTHQTGQEITDGTKNIRKCTQGVDAAGYMVQGLRPTWEQVKDAVPNDFFYDGQYSWYVKPKIKINPNIPGTTLVLKVEIYKKDNTLLRSVDLTRDNFGSNYNGDYIDEFDLGSPSPLKIENGRDLYGTPANANESYADYAIYWYGNCDMWLERVRVENDWANRLFSDFYLLPLNDWIKWETRDIAQNVTRAYKFLVDESDYNMYPAIGYLNDKINQFKPGGSKLSIIALNSIVYTIPEQKPLWIDMMDSTDIDNTFVNSKMNEVFVDPYPLYADKYCRNTYHQPSNIPNTLPRHGYDVNKGILGVDANPDVYEDNFNINIDDNGYHFIDFMKNANFLSRKYDKPLISAIQIHSWYNGAEGLYSLREPTNEEIEALTGIALTYGSKGIIYFAYSSIGALGPNMYSRGLVGNLDVNVSNGCEDGVRIQNAYEQPKWQKIIDLDAKLKILGKDIIKFDNTQSFSYRLHKEQERGDLYANSYFSNIITFKPGSGIPNCDNINNSPQGLIYDCPNYRYMQVGTFKTNTPYENYFMLVNRRASPVKDNNYCGKRYVRIQLKANSNNFSGFYNWNIIEVENNSIKATFDKRQVNTIDLQWIQPGEIKLYKIVPAR
jgi:hypothetical protein